MEVEQREKAVTTCMSQEAIWRLLHTCTCTPDTCTHLHTHPRPHDLLHHTHIHPHLPIPDTAHTRAHTLIYAQPRRTPQELVPSWKALPAPTRLDLGT